MLGIRQRLSPSGVGQGDKTVVCPLIGQSRSVHLLGQPQATVEADIDAKGVPSLEADVTTADHGVFVVMIEMKTFALFSNGLEPFAVSGSAHGHGQARFHRAQDGNQAAADAVTRSNVLNELFLAGFAGAQELVRPLGASSQVLSFLKETVSHALGMAGEVAQTNLGSAQVGAHPLGRKQRTQASMEAQAVPTTQGALDQGAKLVHKAFGNEVFR
jgi:hypothetical protein